MLDVAGTVPRAAGASAARATTAGVRTLSRPPAQVLAAWLHEAATSRVADPAPEARLLRFEDGRVLPLAIDRWAGPVTDGDQTMLDRVRGPVLDVGCGPGRLTAALHLLGHDVLGLDVVDEIPVLARRAGAPLALGSVFGRVPREGEWRTVLLADGNIGIGGDPVRLLERVRALLTADGCVVVELQPADELPDGPSSGQVRLETTGPRRGVSGWFPWALLGTDGLPDVASAAAMRVTERWSGEGREFATLHAA